MRRTLVMFAVVAVFLLVLATPALAIVHPFNPSNDCSDGHGGGVQAVGAIGDTGQVTAPVPQNTPGNSNPDNVGTPDACLPD